MNEKDTFNKQKFALLLEKAKGDRSINQYAYETGVSSSHISRLLRELLDSPPTPELISKLALKAQNKITYRQLMIAAGHISEKSIETEYSPQNKYHLLKQTEQKFSQIIFTYLQEQTFNWNIPKPKDDNFSPDMVVDIEHEKYTRWYLEFKININHKKLSLSRDFIYTYGKIATMDLQPTDKFTIVVNDSRDYRKIINNPPLSIKANIYVMLIDLDMGKVIKEEMICEYI